MNPEVIIAETQSWIEAVVIGLNLCPFAAAPFRQGRIRYAVSRAQTPEALLRDLYEELKAIEAAGPAQVETGFLIHPWALPDLDAHLDFMLAVDGLLFETGLEGELQVVGFHPDYQFADTEPDDPANYSNRSPYPMLHILREESVERAADSHPDVDQIPEDNIARMQALGLARMQALRAACFRGPEAHTAPNDEP